MATIKVAHLPHECTKSTLVKLFSEFGEISSVKINKGENESHAYITYKSSASANEAVSRMDNYRGLLGQAKALTVKTAPTISTKSSKSGSAPDVLHPAKTAAAPNVLRPTKTAAAPNVLRPTRTAAAPNVLHSTKTAAAPDELRPVAIPTSPDASDGSTIKVAINGKGINPSDLIGIFKKFGEIKGTPHIISGNPDYAYINFTDCSAAQSAVKQKKRHFNGVSLTVVISNKPLPKEDEKFEITDDDPLVHSLLAGPYLTKIEEYGQENRIRTVITKSSTISLYGNQSDLANAKIFVSDLIDSIKKSLSTKQANLPTWYLPYFGNTKGIQKVQKRSIVEFSIINSVGHAIKLVEMQEMVSVLSETYPPSHENLEKFLLSNGAFKIGENAHYITICCRGEPAKLSDAIDDLKESLGSDSRSLDIVLTNGSPKIADTLMQVASEYLVDVKSERSVVPMKIILTGQSGYTEKVRLILKEKLTELKIQPEFPSEWQQQQKKVELFHIQDHCVEYQSIKTKFQTTLPNCQIRSVQRIQNQWLWKKYIQHKKMIEEKGNGSANEKELFHGTRQNDPRNIYDSEEGFDMRFSAEGMWGRANYFAVKASYSNNYAYSQSGSKQMFLVKVLTGNSYCCASDSTLRMPPLCKSQNMELSQVRYDSVTGTTGGSQVFMTYDNHKAYPAYLITYM